MWHPHYQPPTTEQWTGRPDSLPQERYFQIIRCCDLRRELPPENHFVLLGFACDAGVRRNFGRVGAGQGPAALRQALRGLAWHGNPKQIIYDAGDIICRDANLESAQASLAAVVELILKNKCRPILIGGGHEIAWGHYQGIARLNPPTDLGIINFDAHFDLRPLQEHDHGSSGTPFLQIAHARQRAKQPFSYACIGIQPAANTRSLFDTAQKLNVTVIEAATLQQRKIADALITLETFLRQHSVIYLSICLDVFAAHMAPGVSAPQILGLMPQHIQPLFERIIKSGKVLSFDIAELCPQHDPEQLTAKLAAALVNQYLLWC